MQIWYLKPYQLTNKTIWLGDGASTLNACKSVANPELKVLEI